MLRKDLEAVGIPYEDGSGRYADFHSLRHRFASILNSFVLDNLGTGTDGLSSIDNERSRRDSNPRYLSVKRFSRPSP